MSVVRSWPAGLSPGVGYSPLTTPAYTTGNLFWADSTNGVNATAAANRRELPFHDVFESVAGALVGYGAPAASSDVMMFRSGYTESVTTALSVSSAGITFIGEETGSAKATVTVTAALASPLTFSGTSVRFENMKFAASTAAVATARLTASGVGAQFVNCDFVCGANDTADCLLITGNYFLVDGCTFTATSTSAARGLRINTATLGGVIQNCTFDGQFSGGACGYNAAHTQIRMYNNTFRNGADLFNITGGRGYAAGVSVSNSGRVDWTY